MVERSLLFFCGQMCVTRTFVQESNIFCNTNILFSKPTKKSTAAYCFSLSVIKKIDNSSTLRSYILLIINYIVLKMKFKFPK